MARTVILSLKSFQAPVQSVSTQPWCIISSFNLVLLIAGNRCSLGRKNAESDFRCLYRILMDYISLKEEEEEKEE